MAQLKQPTALFPIKECFIGKVPLISLGRVSGAPLAITSVTAWSCCMTSVGEQGTKHLWPNLGLEALGRVVHDSLQTFCAGAKGGFQTLGQNNMEQGSKLNEMLGTHNHSRGIKADP